MKSWNDYALILALHRSITLRATAIALGTTHTTVARRLSQIEKQYSAAIFERIPGGYRATPFGEQLVATATQVENVILDSERRYCASNEKLSGPITLSLGEPMSQFLLTKELGEFTSLYPSIQLKVKSSTTFANLDKGEADVVIRGADKLPEHLIGRRLYKLGLCFYAHKDYAANTPRNQWRWIAPIENEVWPQWLAESPYPEVPIGIVIDDIISRYHAILNGVGMGRAACFMGDTHSDLVRLPGSEPVLKYDIWLLTHPDLYEEPKVKLLMQFLTDALLAKKSIVEGSD